MAYNTAIEKTSVEEFMGVYEYSCFGDDHALLVNREGDVLYYDFLTESTFFIEKQHPSLYSSIQIHNFGQAFATCGGNVRNSNAQNEKLIKLWIPDGEELLMKCRIVTGHTKVISNSVALGKNKIVTMSTDKTVRSVNLTTQQI
jgi:WD40 repeat protein